MTEWRYELVPLTLDRARLIWTDGTSVTNFW